MPLERVTLIVGMPQQGKSTLALYKARREWARVIVLDFVRSRTFDGICPTFQSWAALAHWLAHASARSPRWCVALRSAEPQDYVGVLRAAKHLRRVLLVCDETGRICTVPGALEPLVEAAQVGAHFGGGTGVGLYLTAQRPINVPPDVRSQAERVISFRQREPADLEWLAKSFDREFSAQLPLLADHRYAEYPPVSPSEDAHEHGQGDRDRSRDGSRLGRRGADVPEGQPDPLPPGSDEVDAAAPGSAPAPPTLPNAEA